MKTTQVAVAIIRDTATGYLYFQKRQKNPYKSYFGLVGGKVEPNETIADAIDREIEEETDLEIHSKQYLYVINETLTSSEGSRDVALHTYLVDVSGEVKENLDEGEIHLISQSYFLKNKNLFIPTDWLIVKEVIDGKKTFNRILVENNGTRYEIKEIN